jgi:hypothetical protein
MCRVYSSPPSTVYVQCALFSPFLTVLCYCLTVRHPVSPVMERKKCPCWNQSCTRMFQYQTRNADAGGNSHIVDAQLYFCPNSKHLTQSGYTVSPKLKLRWSVLDPHAPRGHDGVLHRPDQIRFDSPGSGSTKFKFSSRTLNFFK